MKKIRDMTEREFLERLDAFQIEDERTRNKVVCALLGHSKIQKYFMGYYSCARCGAQVGDSLGSTYGSAPETVIVGHNCPTCRENYAKLGWQDKLFTPEPFAEQESEDE